MNSSFNKTMKKQQKHNNLIVMVICQVNVAA